MLKTVPPILVLGLFAFALAEDFYPMPLFKRRLLEAEEVSAVPKLFKCPFEGKCCQSPRLCCRNMCCIGPRIVSHQVPCW